MSSDKLPSKFQIDDPVMVARSGRHMESGVVVGVAFYKNAVKYKVLCRQSYQWYDSYEVRTPLQAVQSIAKE